MLLNKILILENFIAGIPLHNRIYNFTSFANTLIFQSLLMIASIILAIGTFVQYKKTKKLFQRYFSRGFFFIFVSTIAYIVMKISAFQPKSLGSLICGLSISICIIVTTYNFIYGTRLFKQVRRGNR